uniref:STAS domain-containing protein n=1 Tax=Streptomyces polyasparticus TaxID=2767826 RepID=UPI0034D60DF7
MDRLGGHEASPGSSPAFLTPTLVGELDVINAGKLSDTVAHEPASGHRHLLLHLAGVTYCGAGSLHTLHGMRPAASHVGGSPALTAASTCIREALDRTGMRGLLPFTR